MQTLLDYFSLFYITVNNHILKQILEICAHFPLNDWKSIVYLGI